MRGTPEIPYRADIDGLRAIAVLSVIGFHANQSLIPGGFVGVDIFFVISGFLIASLILKKLKDGTFGFLEFYGRRIRRLFPALTVVLLTTLILGWFTLFPAEFAALGKNTPAGAHIDKLNDLLRFFQRIGVHRIIVVGQVPSWPRPLQQMLYRAYRADPLHKIPDRLPSRDMVPSIDVMTRIDRQLKEIASDTGATFVSARDVLCNENGCLALLGSGDAKEIVQLDMNHLSVAGSRFLVRHIANQIFE
jgi:hypothetical protein